MRLIIHINYCSMSERRHLYLILPQIGFFVISSHAVFFFYAQTLRGERVEGQSNRLECYEKMILRI